MCSCSNCSSTERAPEINVSIEEIVLGVKTSFWVGLLTGNTEVSIWWLDTSVVAVLQLCRYRTDFPA